MTPEVRQIKITNGRAHSYLKKVDRVVEYRSELAKRTTKISKNL